MNVVHTKLGMGVLTVGLMLVVASLGPGAKAPLATADLGVPGGISALPSAAPAIPGVANQGIPAVIRARAPGNSALVTVFCDPAAALPGVGGQVGFPGGTCADANGDGSAVISFELKRVYPPDGAPVSKLSGSPLCRDGAPCDYNAADGVVVVEVVGGGVNEIVEVQATDENGESRSVRIVVVDTILAWGPSGVLSTAAQHEPAFVSYACPSIGSQNIDDAHDLDATLPALAEARADDDGISGLDDLWELLYGGKPLAPPPLGGSGLNYGGLDNLQIGDKDFPFVWCGGDTQTPQDDFVDFQTDLGVFSVDPSGVGTILDIATLHAEYGITMPPTLDFDCGEGKDIDVADIDSLAVWGTVLLGMPAEGGCDADFARNGVVTTMVLGNGEVGVATITAQQGGGASPPRTINLTFVGEAALSVFIDAPENIGTKGGEFTVAVVDQDGRPVGGETVECTVEPTGGALVVMPQTGTTSSVDSEDPGALTMSLVPTGASVLSGEKLTLTCVLDRDRSVSASATIALSTTPGLESVELPAAGCFPVASTWKDGTNIATVAEAVEPADALNSIWVYEAESGTWVGYSPNALGASDLTSVDRLEALFICMAEPGAVQRPTL